MGFPPYPPTQRTQGNSKHIHTHSHVHTRSHTYKHTTCTHTNWQTAEPPRSGLSELFSLRWWVCVNVYVRLGSYKCVCIWMCACLMNLWSACVSVGIWNGVFLLSSSSLSLSSLSVSSLLSGFKSSLEANCREEARCGQWCHQKQIPLGGF